MEKNSNETYKEFVERVFGSIEYSAYSDTASPEYHHIRDYLEKEMLKAYPPDLIMPIAHDLSGTASKKYKKLSPESLTEKKQLYQKEVNRQINLFANDKHEVNESIIESFTTRWVEKNNMRYYWEACRKLTVYFYAFCLSDTEEAFQSTLRNISQQYPTYPVKIGMLYGE